MFASNSNGSRVSGSRLRIGASVLIFSVLCSQPALAQNVESWNEKFIDGITNGDFDISFRYRYEYVESDNFANDANASTLRTRLLYKSDTVWNTFLTVNMDDVRPIVADNFNDTRNGKIQYPVVPDPKGTDLNLASLTWVGVDGLTAVLGRQRIIRGNSRYIGNVGWRQNEQTYDSLSFAYSPIEKLDLFYAYVDRVKRIFGPENGVPTDDFRSDSHLIDAAYTFDSWLKLSGYAYLLKLENAPALSSQTVGVRGAGSFDVADDIKLGYVAELARQSDYGDNPNSYDANYYLAEGSFNWSNFGFRLGYEVLEGNGTIGQSFVTPLATLHKFNGWADQFIVTPPGGLEDLYAEANAKWLGATWRLIYHDFSANKGGADYGSEIDFAVSRKFGKHYTALFKFAVYDAKTWNVDVNKVWLQFTADF